MGAANHQMAATFWREWQARYGAVPPLAHCLRPDDSGHNWIRFHALPFAQRYAENANEHREILRRAERLAAEMLGTGSACWLVHFGTRRWPSPAPHTNLVVPEPDEGFDWVGRVTQSHWRPSRFTRLLADIASDRTGPILWMNRETGAIFAPYDGGFDLFPASADVREQLRERYADWLSDRPDGL
jgi:hypothetical protein